MMKNEGGFFQKVFLVKKETQSLADTRQGHWSIGAI
jgi:hypothetical protein